MHPAVYPGERCTLLYTLPAYPSRCTLPIPLGVTDLHVHDVDAVCTGVVPLFALLTGLWACSRSLFSEKKNLGYSTVLRERQKDGCFNRVLRERQRKEEKRQERPSQINSRL